MDQIKDFKTVNPLKRCPKGTYNHTLVLLHMCFDAKFELSRKVKMVSKEDMTVTMDEESYYGVGNVDTTKIGLFLGKTNGLEVMEEDVGNTYLHIFNKENIYNL